MKPSFKERLQVALNYQLSMDTTMIRAELFLNLPTELQENILQKLDSAKHLRALSTATHHVRALVLPLLYAKVTLGPLVSNKSVETFAEHCAPQLGRYCRDLKLAFSLGPMLNVEADLRRAQLFAEILKQCSSGLRSLSFDAGGSNLCHCVATLEAMASGFYPNLTDLDMRCYDPDDDEIASLANVFDAVASSLSSMPQLQSLGLQGEWNLSSRQVWHDEIDTSPIFNSLSSLLHNKPNLTNLCLGHLSINPSHLHRLMKETSNLQSLTLNKLEDFSLQACLDSLLDTPAQVSLQELTLHMRYVMIPSGSLRFKSKQQYDFPKLKMFDLTLNSGNKVAATSDLSVFALYGSLFRCSQVTFPSLETVGLDDAFSYSVGTTKTLAMHLLMSRRKSMPGLKSVLYAHETPDCNIENIEALLGKCGVALTRCEPAQRPEVSDKEYPESYDSSMDSS